MQCHFEIHLHFNVTFCKCLVQTSKTLPALFPIAVYLHALKVLLLFVFLTCSCFIRVEWPTQRQENDWSPVPTWVHLSSFLVSPSRNGWDRHGGTHQSQHSRGRARWIWDLRVAWSTYWVPPSQHCTVRPYSHPTPAKKKKKAKTRFTAQYQYINTHYLYMCVCIYYVHLERVSL